ncbi:MULTISPECIES: DUF6412 domain-containing protein [Microbacterium]|jgi:hypothetical protein|uniref:DUF6412 domain-containing protein n=1 Tax=Microbacterium TaxID=33882 RepID=UPI000E75D079|nr:MULTISPECIES: DUF6412 domain-containing protein [Microbacterium]MDF2579097.1 hypothetical protein [Microbacterium sp.]RKE63988.1 hypothetical protein DEU36_1208 [Microbacterium sp. AG238]WJM16394.1 DUF6412 domain-containing protein [Microbacterium arborescens]
MPFLSVIPMLLSVIGAMSVGDSSGLATAAAVALVTMAIAVVSISAATTTTGAAGSRRPHPRRSISPSTLLAQSDPDAPGRRRPRAPGYATSAA